MRNSIIIAFLTLIFYMSLTLESNSIKLPVSNSFIKKEKGEVMKLKPMLAKLGTRADLEKEGYLYEPKLDGIRALCHVDKGMKFITRNGLDITHQFPEFDFRKQITAQTCILDGEIIALNKKGNPDFNLLQNRASNDVDGTFVVFDILWKNGVSLVNKPLQERKKILDATIKPKGALEKIVSVDDGKKLWELIRKHKLEGVVAKEIESIYHPGKRTNSWIKIKAIHSVDCVIIGFTQEKRHVSSLALGLYKDHHLYYVGKVGTGFTSDDIHMLYQKLQKITVKTPHVINAQDAAKDIVWAKPKMVAEIEYLMMTKDKRLRAPVYLHLRLDKEPAQCTFTQIS